MGKKPSAGQQRVLDLIAGGYELAESMGPMCRAWLQLGGAGRGGPVERVSGSTVKALEKRGLIEMSEQVFPRRTYRLARTPDTGAGHER